MLHFLPLTRTIYNPKDNLNPSTLLLSSMSNQQRHVPLNSDSELESFDPVRTSAGAPSIAATQHVPLNSESEFEPSASNDDNDNDESESRGRRSGGGFAAQTGAYPEGNSGDDDDTLPPLSDARARSRTPRGARSKSRSRSRARHQGGLKTEVLMNSGSEESDGLTGGDGTEEERAGRPAGYVPQNSESGAFPFLL